MQKEETGGERKGEMESKQQRCSTSSTSARFAVEEALLLAQSRAREAEDVLCRYDVQMEAAVLKALTMLERSRERQGEALTRVRALEAAVVAEERDL
eukprot:CAMPEP_0177729514 /NCGR_PEP_ID=MMETSP0484_2-20121128/21478_1 /TAXON_ID=354590 /ORGANISM="Rhodomonas lens, Strain RHODO" /LENGTH=96 /DNA_ID=CAMNT_0019242405 /DNA_START=133 /DNA_END=420 /DNA_ORIENTATION=+